MANKIAALLKRFIPAIPSWVTGFNAHWLFGYALFVTFPNAWAFGIATVLFGVKEFYVDKHFETTPQTFMMNLGDFGSYMLGMVLAFAAVHFGFVA